jgi:hypothetical protein
MNFKEKLLAKPDPNVPAMIKTKVTEEVDLEYEYYLDVIDNEKEFISDMIFEFLQERIIEWEKDSFCIDTSLVINKHNRVGHHTLLGDLCNLVTDVINPIIVIEEEQIKVQETETEPESDYDSETYY